VPSTIPYPGEAGQCSKEDHGSNIEANRVRDVENIPSLSRPTSVDKVTQTLTKMQLSLRYSF
jgi:hypothetical protein